MQSGDIYVLVWAVVRRLCSSSKCFLIMIIITRMKYSRSLYADKESLQEMLVHEKVRNRTMYMSESYNYIHIYGHIDGICVSRCCCVLNKIRP